MRVFGRIQASACFLHQTVQYAKQFRFEPHTPGKIQCQRRAGHGKGQQARRWDGTTALEHSQEGAAPSGGNGGQHVLKNERRVVFRNNALVLLESLATINAVPVGNAVQRVKKRQIVHSPFAQAGRMPVPVQLIKGPQTPAVNQRKRRCKGNRQSARLQRSQPSLLRMVTSHVNTPPQLVITGCTVNPGYAVLMLRVQFPGQMKKVVEPLKTHRPGQNLAAADGYQADAGPQDDAGQAQPANSGGKQFSLLLGATGKQTALTQQAKLQHMAAKGTTYVVILAVYIVGYGIAQSD